MFKKTNDYSTLLRTLPLSLGIILLDQMTKAWIRHRLQLGQVIELLPGLNIYYVQNYGISFGLFSYPDGWQNNLLIVMNVCLVFILLLAFFYQQIDVHNLRFKYVGYSLIMGGALGNLTDRFFYKAVIDFIDLHAYGMHFATFNIADLAITCGYLVFCWLFWKQKKH